MARRRTCHLQPILRRAVDGGTKRDARSHHSHGGKTPALLASLVLAGKRPPATASSTIPTYGIPVEAYFVIHFVIWPF